MLKCPHDTKHIYATIIDGAFLDETPQKSMDTKNFKKTNVMMGANKDEGVFFIMYYLTELFKNEETVFVNREDFIRGAGDLNQYVKSVSLIDLYLIVNSNGDQAILSKRRR